MVSRRQLLLGAAGLAGGSALAGGGGALAAEAYKRGFAEAEAKGEIKVAKATLPWSGKHQGGVEAPAQAHTNFIALNLKPGITRDDMLRWMLLLTEDIAALATGEAVLAEDVKYSFEQLISKQAAPQFRTLYAEVASVTVVDPRTVRFDFKRVNPELPLIVGGMPVFSRQWGLENGAPKPFERHTDTLSKCRVISRAGTAQATAALNSRAPSRW